MAQPRLFELPDDLLRSIAQHLHPLRDIPQLPRLCRTAARLFAFTTTDVSFARANLRVLGVGIDGGKSYKRLLTDVGWPYGSRHGWYHLGETYRVALLAIHGLTAELCGHIVRSLSWNGATMSQEPWSEPLEQHLFGQNRISMSNNHNFRTLVHSLDLSLDFVDPTVDHCFAALFASNAGALPIMRRIVARGLLSQTQLKLCALAACNNGTAKNYNGGTADCDITALYLIKHLDEVGATKEYHNLALLKSIINGHPETVRYLVSSPHADPRACESHALRTVCMNRSFDDIVSILVDSGRLDVADLQMALYFATIYDWRDVISKLLRMPGVRPDSPWRSSAAHEAASPFRLAVVALPPVLALFLESGLLRPFSSSTHAVDPWASNGTAAIELAKLVSHLSRSEEADSHHRRRRQHLSWGFTFGTELERTIRLGEPPGLNELGRRQLALARARMALSLLIDHEAKALGDSDEQDPDRTMRVAVMKRDSGLLKGLLSSGVGDPAACAEFCAKFAVVNEDVACARLLLASPRVAPGPSDRAKLQEWITDHASEEVAEAVDPSRVMRILSKSGVRRWKLWLGAGAFYAVARWGGWSAGEWTFAVDGAVALFYLAVYPALRLAHYVRYEMYA